MKNKSLTKDQMIAEIAASTTVDVGMDGLTVKLFGHYGFYGNEQSERNEDALIKAGKIIRVGKHGDLFLNIDHTALKIAALQTFIKGWRESQKHDFQTGVNVRKFAGFPRVSLFGNGNDCHYVLNNGVNPVWAPDVDPSIYTTAAIDAESRIQNAEQHIARLEYAANVTARKAYFARLAGIQTNEDIPEFIL